MAKDDIATAFHVEHNQDAAAIKVVGVPTSDQGRTAFYCIGLPTPLVPAPDRSQG
jgi:hypothetical protein